MTIQKLKNLEITKLLTTSTNTESRGFTLIEMIATVTIFVIVITIATGVLITIIKTQRKNNAQRIIQQESKNVLETITREAKLVAGSDSFPPFTVGNNPPFNTGGGVDGQKNAYTDGNQLILTNGSDMKTYFLDNSAGYGIVKVTEEKDSLDSTKPDLTKAFNITSENVNVTELKFTVSSKSIPEAGKKKPEVQPFVNITISLESRKDTPATRTKASFKTTASSLKYVYAQNAPIPQPPPIPPGPGPPPIPPGPGACSPPIVIDSGDVGVYSSIAIDSQGKVHIIYLDYNNLIEAKLKYATNASGSWENTTLVSGGHVGQASIAIDSQDKVHISYAHLVGVNQDLKYATNVSGSWEHTTVDPGGNIGFHNSIAIDSQDKVHISYHNSLPIIVVQEGELKYATNASGSWVCTTLDAPEDTNVGVYSSLALDSNDKAHIVHHDGTNDDLKYTTNVSGSWVNTTLDSAGNTGFTCSIAIDSNDKLHISYYDGTNGDLKYATNASGSWVYTTLDSVGHVGVYTSIAIDSADKIHISYWDWTNWDLKYATNASGSWVYTTLDSLGDVGEFSAIAVDSSDGIHISYWDRTNGSLKYFYCD